MPSAPRPGQRNDMRHAAPPHAPPARFRCAFHPSPKPNPAITWHPLPRRTRRRQGRSDASTPARRGTAALARAKGETHEKSHRGNKQHVDRRSTTAHVENRPRLHRRGALRGDDGSHRRREHAGDAASARMLGGASLRDDRHRSHGGGSGTRPETQESRSIRQRSARRERGRRNGKAGKRGQQPGRRRGNRARMERGQRAAQHEITSRGRLRRRARPIGKAHRRRARGGRHRRPRTQRCAAHHARRELSGDLRAHLLLRERGEIPREAHIRKSADELTP